MSVAFTEKQTPGLLSLVEKSVEAFDSSRRPEWFSGLKLSAASIFRSAGFPNRKQEEWRFTPVSSVAETPFEAPSRENGSAGEIAAAVESALLNDIDGPALVFIDGQFAPQYSRGGSLSGLFRYASIADLLESDPDCLEPHLGKIADIENSPFGALNTSLFCDGAAVIVAKNMYTPYPVQIVHLSTGFSAPSASASRALIVAEQDARATVIESFVSVGGAPIYSGAVTEIRVAENASIEHYKITNPSDKTFHFALVQAEVAEAGRFVSHNATLSGALARNEIGSRFTGEGGSTELYGLSLVKCSDLVDNHTFIDHALPHCESHELYKAILNDQARGVFSGKVLVRQDAQKTDAKQTNKSLVLSKQAQMNTKPQLEIYADDVKCTHGATVGQQNDEAIFYLRSRGIDLVGARAIMNHAFAGEVAAKISVEPLKERIDARIFDWERGE